MGRALVPLMLRYISVLRRLFLFLWQEKVQKEMDMLVWSFPRRRFAAVYVRLIIDGVGCVPRVVAFALCGLFVGTRSASVVVADGMRGLFFFLAVALPCAVWSLGLFGRCDYLVVGIIWSSRLFGL